MGAKRGPYGGLNKAEFACVSILKIAKSGAELEPAGLQQSRWQSIIRLAFEALGKPSIAELERLQGIVETWPHEVA